jgi:hypothetical protein
MTKKQSEKQVQEKVVETRPSSDGLVKMVHPHGKIAHVHTSMIPAYKSGGYKEA